MRRSLLLPTTLLLLLSASSVHAQVAEITGTVTSATGEPFRLAHVHLLPFNTQWEGPLFDHVITSVEVKADGSWELSVGNPGYYEILFTALDHEYFRLPMPIDGGEPEITVDARLALIPVRETLEMKVGGPFVDHDPERAIPLQRDSSGRWWGEIESNRKEVEVQVIGIATPPGRPWLQRWVNLITSESDERGSTGTKIRHYYDGGGDYVSVVPVVNGRARVVLDIERHLERIEEAAWDRGSATVSPPLFGELYALQEKMEREDSELEEYLQNLSKRATEARDVVQAADSLVRTADSFRAIEMRRLLDSDRPLLLRQFAAVQLGRIEYDRVMREPVQWRRMDSGLAREITRVAPVESPMWEMEPFLAMLLFGADDRGSINWRDEHESTFADASARSLRGYALATRAAHAGGYRTIEMTAVMMSRRRRMEMPRPLIVDTLASDSLLFAKLYADLVAGYGDHWRFRQLVDMIDPARAMMPGELVPPFVFDAMSGDSITRESMLGRVYLIDLWASWCGPCVADQPHLHRLYEEHGGEDFEIISISFDQNWPDVEAFRQARYPMPWQHVHAGDQGEAIWRMFEMSGVPRMVLVDRTGHIIAVDQGLRGEELVRTVGRVMEGG